MADLLLSRGDRIKRLVLRIVYALVAPLLWCKNQIHPKQKRVGL